MLAWQRRLPQDLAAFPADSREFIDICGRSAVFGASKHVLPTGSTLLVFHAFVHTWSRPTYLSLGAVGRWFAEGLVVDEDGKVYDAPDDLMWGFR